MAKLTPFKAGRQAWIQFHKRNPINLRPLLGIAKHTNPKTLALGVTALCTRYETLGHEELLAEAQTLAARMIDVRSKGSKLLAWGYPFDWQSRAFFAPAEEQDQLAAKYRAGGMGYGEAKKELLAKIDAYFGPARERRKQLAADPDGVEAILTAGAKRARQEAQKTMEKVRKAVGMLPRPV